MISQPLVSIVIPTHRPEHLRNAVLCALAQTYRNIEIIVSDNSTATEIRDFCAAYPGIIYRKNTDGKPASNIAQGLTLARGEFIKYLFDDDLIYPHCIESMLGWLAQFSPENQAAIGLITSARHLINDSGICYDEIREADIQACSMVQGSTVVQKILSTLYNFVGEFSTVMFRRSLIDTTDPLSIFSAYGESFTLGLVDVPLYLALLQKSNLLYIPHSLSAFRKHSEGGSNVAFNPGFHMVVSDWLRLIRAAYRAGDLDRASAIAGARVQMVMNDHFKATFPEPMSITQQEAQSFLQELESTTQ
jgi:glycosyltransferase involved in cell wall biosynthesis